MHIALIIRKLTVAGGVQRQALSLARELKRTGYRITIYTAAYDRECFPDLIADTPVVALPESLRRRTGGVFGFVAEERMARSLASLIAPDTDLLHPHDSPAHHVASYYKKYVRPIPSIWQMNELPALRWPPELLPIMENPAMHDIPYRPAWFKRFGVRLKLRREARFIRAQDAIAVFDEYHKNLLRRFTGRDASVIPSGVDAAHIPFRPRSAPQKTEPLRLLSSGIFLSYRRFEDCIRMLPLLVRAGYDPRLTILGEYRTDQFYFNALRRLAEELGVDGRIEFFGPYRDSELARFLDESSVFVFPHLQSQGLSVNEALASGLPSIVTPMLGTYETLTHGKDAMFAEPRSPESLARAVRDLVENPELYRRISEQGRKTMERYSWERAGRAFSELFERVKSRGTFV